MSAIQLNPEYATADRLRRLAYLLRAGQASELMERTLDKLFVYETEQSQTQFEQLQSDLRGFEQQYGMSSEEFYRRYQAGETDDRMDFVEWASLVQMAENMKARLALLTGDEG